MKIGAGAGEDAGAAGASAAAAAAAEVAGVAGGRVALWSLKNQLHPIWTFETKSGALGLMCMAAWLFVWRDVEHSCITGWLLC
jgi:hypothetical protein